MKKKILILVFLVFLSLPIFARAAICDGAQKSTTLCDPTGQGTLENFGFSLAEAFGAAIGLTVILFLMFAGFRMVMAQGNEEALVKAKAAFQWTLSGLVLALLAYLVINATYIFIGGKEPGSTAGTLNPIKYNTFGALATGGLITGTLLIAGTLSMLMIMIAGVRYLTARGNDQQVEQARQSLMWSVIGLAVILLAYVITVATAKLFGG
jgi:hypothetical protein